MTDEIKAPEIPKKKIHKTMPPLETKEVDGPPEVKPKKEKKEPVPKMPKAENITLLKELTFEDKMPLQCKQIIGLLSDAQNKTLTREALLEVMVPVIATRQPIERIYSFYRPRLISGGWISIVPIVAPTVTIIKE